MDLETMQGIFDGMPEPIVVMDTTGCIQAANKAWYTMAAEHDVDPEEAGVGHDYRSICQQVTGQTREEAAAVVGGVEAVLLGQRQVFHFEYRCQRQGAMAWCMLRASPFSHRDTGYVAVIHTDVSRLRLEIEEERVARLEQERKLREAIQENSRLKDQFYAVVAHELRNPANSIVGWTRILQKRTDQEALRHGLDVIYRNTLSLLRTLRDFLDIFSIARGTLEVDRLPFDLSEEVELAAESVRPEAGEKRIVLALDALPHGCIVLADRDRIHQVICNLLLNAIKFSREEGTVTVAVRKGGSHVVVEVSDSGLGIPPQVLPHIFEPFKQLSPKYGGLGLGLVVAKSIIELHDGTITAHSDGEGQGAVFAIHLPLLSTESTPR